jgi:hypothetical protein
MMPHPRQSAAFVAKERPAALLHHCLDIRPNLFRQVTDIVQKYTRGGNVLT